MAETEFVRRFADAGLQGFRCFSASCFQPAPQLFNGRGLDEKGEQLAGKLFLDMDSALHIDVKDRHFTIGPNAMEFAFEGAVIFSLIHHFPFHEGLFFDLLFEGFGGDEVIVYAVFFCTSWFTGCR